MKENFFFARVLSMSKILLHIINKKKRIKSNKVIQSQQI